MRNIATATLLAAMLLAGGSAFAADFSIGIRIGAPPRPRVVRVVPRYPGPDYIWVAGYWYPVGGGYEWVDGYWTLPPYRGAYWVAPRYDGNLYFVGFWDGPRGRFAHGHKWDKHRRHRAHRYRRLRH